MNMQTLANCQESDFFLFYEMATVVFCSGLFVNQDGALQRIRAEPCDNCLGSRVDDVLGLSFFGFFFRKANL